MRGFFAATTAGIVSLTGCAVSPPYPTSTASSEVSTPPVPAEITAIAPVNNSSYEIVKRCNRPTDAKVLITIDDFGTREQVEKYLKVLRANNMKAVVFPKGDWAEDNLDLISEIKSEGHIVGNHTYTHARLGELATSNEAAFYGEIYPLEGVANTSPMLLRPPYGDGADNPKVMDMLTDKNIQACGWNADSYDWSGSTVDEIMHRLTKGDKYSEPITEGSVVLFHLHSEHGADALTPLARYLIENDMPYEQLAE